MTPSEDFFDEAFLEELRELAEAVAPAEAEDEDDVPPPPSGPQQAALAGFLESNAGPLSEDGLVEEPAYAFTQRVNRLVESCRHSDRRSAVEAVESFLVFVQTLVPSLPPPGARLSRRVLYRLAPTLIHVAFADFGDDDEARAEGRAALESLQSVLAEVAPIKLAPSEAALVLRSIDQMTSLVADGQYAMATGLVASQLLSLIERNRLARNLYRIMELEVSVQRYLKERRGYPTPRIRLPEDVLELHEEGPVRVLSEKGRRFLQFHVPDIPVLSDVVVHLVSDPPGRQVDVRLDALGSVVLDLPDGTWRIGFEYEPA